MKKISKRLWERTNSLIERLENIIPEIGENFFRKIGEILTSVAEINRLRSLLFIPLVFKKVEGQSEDVYLIFVYKNKFGKYKSLRIMPTPEIWNSVITFFSSGIYSASRFFDIYRKPDDVGELDDSLVSLSSTLKYGENIIGYLLMDRDTPFLREEKFFTKWFEKELIIMMVKAVVESPSRLVNFVESLVGSSGRTAVAIVDTEGTILKVNEKFFELFNIRKKTDLEDLHLSDLPWLKDHEEIVAKITEHVVEGKSFSRSRWINVSPTDERYLQINGFPIKTDLIDRRFYVWTFEDRTSEKMEEIRRDFIHAVLKRKMQICEEISAILRGGRYDKYREFLNLVPKIVCERLSFISEGVIFYIRNFTIYESHGKPYTICASLRNSIKGINVSELIDEIDRIRRDNGIISEPSVVKFDSQKFSEDLKAKGFDYILVIPIIIQDNNQFIGYILLFSKKKSIFWRILQRLPKMAPLSTTQYEEIDLFIQFAEKVSTYLQIVKKEAEMIEREKFAKEIYDHVEDIVLIESFDGTIEFVNRRAGEFYGYSRESLIGKSVDLLIPENARSLKNNIVKELQEKGEFNIIVPNKDSLGKVKWLNFNFRVVKFRGMEKVLVVGHDITELRENLKTINDMLVGIISALFNIMENRSSALKKHSINVAYLAGEIARKIKNDEFSDERKITYLIMAGLLHDIGKITIPSTILAQPKEQLIKKAYSFNLYKSHPVTGANIVRKVPLPSNELISKWIGQHHEKLDGSGFPMGNNIKPDEITLGARIIAVADEFENEVMSKPLHKVKTPEEVLNRLKNSGEFDKSVVDALIELYNEGIVERLVEKDEEADEKIKEIFNLLTGICGERQNLEEYK